MILKYNTVFVLGAGASDAYGFPLGADLLRKIWQSVKNSTSEECQALRQAARYGIAEVEKFAEDLQNCARDSVDAFLNSRNDYDLIGRCAIAQQLMKYENEEVLRTTHQDRDWVSHLLTNIFTTSPENFRKNRLKIITFNFDRSFEWTLYLALRAHYGAPMAAELMKVIEVIHVHGQLGTLPIGTTTGPVRPYEPSTNPDDILTCANQIKIVHHTVDDKTLAQARDMLQRAERVYFLGFSYHRLNLEKLNIPSSLGSKNKGVVIGTRFGMSHRAVSDMPDPIKDRITFLHQDDDIMSLLRNQAHIYDWEQPIINEAKGSA